MALTRAHLSLTTVAVFFLVLFAARDARSADSEFLFEASTKTMEERVELSDMVVSAYGPQRGWVSLNVGTDEKWPGMRLHAEGKNRWDISAWSALEIDVKNPSDTALTVHLRIDNPFGTGGRKKPWTTDKTVVAPHSTTTLRAKIRRQQRLRPTLEGMQRYPQGLDRAGIDPGKVSSVLLFLQRDQTPRTFLVGPLRATDPYRQSAWEQLKSKDFYPFVNEFGQFQHAQWDTKVRSLGQLAAQRASENRDLERHPAADNVCPYGGFKDGPQLSATGHFRVALHAGQWWFVDPDGCLFWSHGLGVVRHASPTIIDGREVYFPDAISADGNDSTFHGEHKDAQGNTHRTYDFAQANLRKKYGPRWRSKMVGRISQRLGSWGFNTYGLWSEPQLARAGTHAYTDWVYYRSPTIIGSRRTGELVDMWHDRFATNVRRAASKLTELNDDPWLLGVFVDNEMRWGDARSFIDAVLRSPKEQPARQRLIDFLRQHYKDVGALNDAWSLKLSSFDKLSHTHLKNWSAAHGQSADAFFALSAEHYYRQIAAVIRQHAPDKLYLCSRFNGRFVIPERAAAKFCDVLSYNVYRHSVANFTTADAINKPVLISEWHFGAMDSGMFGAGLVAVDTQAARAAAYVDYAQGALSNPQIVGAHWFQYRDEPLTGRALDGENFQIGFVDVADTPYSELIGASRQIGRSMYAVRAPTGSAVVSERPQTDR